MGVDMTLVVMIDRLLLLAFPLLLLLLVLFLVVVGVAFVEFRVNSELESEDDETDALLEFMSTFLYDKSSFNGPPVRFILLWFLNFPFNTR